MATKPYAGGGAYIDRMSDYCGGCRYDPKMRRRRGRLPVHRRLLGVPRPQPRAAGRQPPHAPPLRGLDRLKDLDEVVEQEERRGTEPALTGRAAVRFRLRPADP